MNKYIYYSFKQISLQNKKLAVKINQVKSIKINKILYFKI